MPSDHREAKGISSSSSFAYLAQTANGRIYSLDRFWNKEPPKKQMQPLRFLPRTVAKNPVLSPVLSSEAKMPLSSSALCIAGRAGAVWAKDKLSLIVINGASVSAPIKEFPFSYPVAEGIR